MIGGDSVDPILGIVWEKGDGVLGDIEWKVLVR